MSYPYADFSLDSLGVIRETLEPIKLHGQEFQAARLMFSFASLSADRFLVYLHRWVKTRLESAGTEDRYLWIRKVHLTDPRLNELFELLGFVEDDEKMWRAPHGQAVIGDLEVKVYRSEKDGTRVVDIIGPTQQEEPAEPLLRVYLNEASLYENPKYGET